MQGEVIVISNTTIELKVFPFYVSASTVYSAAVMNIL